MSDGSDGKQNCRDMRFTIQEESSEQVKQINGISIRGYLGNPEECARDRLINATIACIENEGIHAVTIRGIAEEASLNSAAINYYFGTKDKLVEEALHRAMATAMANFKMFEEKGKDSFDILQDILRYYFEGMISHPEIFKAHLYNPSVKNRYDLDAMRWFNDFSCQLMEVITESLPEADELEVKIAVMQLISSILVPGILPGLYREILGIDIKDPEMQRKFIDHLLDCYIRRGDK